MKRTRKAQAGARTTHRALRRSFSDPELISSHLQETAICDWQAAGRTGVVRRRGLPPGHGPSRALPLYEQALAAYEAAGDGAGVGKACLDLGLCHVEMGQYARALSLYEQALAAFTEAGDGVGVGKACHNLGLCHVEMGQPARALPLYKQARAAYAAANDSTGFGEGTWLRPVLRPDAVAASGSRKSVRNSVLSAMRSLVGRTRSRPDAPGAEDSPGSGGDGGRTVRRGQLLRSISDSDLTMSQKTSDLVPDVVGAESDQGGSRRSFSDPESPLSQEDPAADLDDPQLVSPTRGKVVKSLRMMMREARLQKLQEALDQEKSELICSESGMRHSASCGAMDEMIHSSSRGSLVRTGSICSASETTLHRNKSKDGHAAEEGEAQCKLPAVSAAAPTTLGLEWENIGVAKPATGTEIHNNWMLAEALANKSTFSKDELVSFQVFDLSYGSYIAVDNSYFRPAPPSGLTRQQHHSLRSRAGCPSPQLPQPFFRALARAARSPDQSRGFQRNASSTDGAIVVDFSREASIAAKMSLGPPVLNTLS